MNGRKVSHCELSTASRNVEAKSAGVIREMRENNKTKSSADFLTRKSVEKNLINTSITRSPLKHLLYFLNSQFKNAFKQNIDENIKSYSK